MNAYLNPIKGWYNGIGNLDFVAVNDSAGGAAIPAGSVCSLKSNGKMQLGLAPYAMPLFAFNASDAYDVAGPAGTHNVVGVHGANMLTLVATGGYELQSTEIKTGQSDGMIINAYLTADAPDGAAPGKLAVAALFEDTVCGQVSRVPFRNHNGDIVVSFWSMNIPGVPGGTD